ncbi:LuxR C-terminal-related transcriptional regulator [Streptomyces sp. NPDC048514]|uniref:helix-turn-helix transcriptional regulator n=1 Tax=Streptomyces sp. NPDC048514 TaxID=3365564 RepID=UPI00371D20E3
MRGADPGAPWPLTGRSGETSAFTAVWANRRCQAVVIYGPAGVGKTRLAEDFLARAVAEGFEGARATATAAAATVPLGAIAHLIPADVDLSDPVRGFAAVAGALAGHPRKRRRWALSVDDLHLLDAASAMLVRQLMDAGVVRLIGTVRTGEPVTDAVAALAGGDTVYRFDLEAFDAQNTEAVLQAALGGPVGRRTLRELHSASGGNVLFLRELVLGALRAGTLTSDGEIWHLADDRPMGTPRLTELIRGRLATADARARPALELLALCEPLSLDDIRQTASLDGLAGLEAAGLVRVITDRRRTVVRLAHPLYGEVLRGEISGLRRRALLLAQADRVRSHGARRRDDALHLATWQLAATGTADPASLVRAAALARHAHDYPQVVTLLAALRDGRRTIATDLMLGEAFFQMGRWDEAEVVLARADGSARGETDVLSVVLARSANLLWSGAPFERALAVNDDALGRLTGPAGRRALRTNEGYMRVAVGQPVRGLELLADLETDVDEAPDINAWLRGALTKPTALALVGRTREAMEDAGRAYDVHRRIDERALVSHPAVETIPLVLALSEAGRLADARTAGERAYTELAAAGNLVRVWMAVLVGRVEWLSGHPVLARRWWAEAAALARSIHLDMALRLLLGYLAACAAVLGDHDAAEAALAERRSLAELPPGFLSAGEERLGEAWLLVARGHLARARSVLLDAAGAARSTGHSASEALLLTDVARLGGAREAAPRLSVLAGVCDGELAPARSLFASALVTDDAEQLLAAAGRLGAIGANLLVAEATTAAAAAWQRNGDIRRAAAARQRADAFLPLCQGARTPLLTTAQTTVPLTAREKEVAFLAAAGTPSKEIATALHVSVRTVDNHLQRVFAKLGVTTRRELADVLNPPPVSPAG